MDLVGLVFVGLLVLGAVLTIRKVRFTAAAQRIARQIGEEGGFRRDRLPRDPRGKVTRAAAVDELDRCRAAVDAEPDDWRAWFHLGVAYGDMRDPRAARAAVRRAVALERAQTRA